MNGVVSARDHRGPLELEADVVVVGSGSAGAVVATELALAGQRVVILEEGPHIPNAEYGAMRPSESLRHAWRDGGTTFAMGLGDTPAINVTMGRCVGGSSMLTGGVCFRIPAPVLDEWSRAHGLADYTEARMLPFAERVEKAISVEEVPLPLRSRSTALFAEGAERSGFALKPLRRNTRGCKGCGRCNFGCPEGAKISVDVGYLPRAFAKGARVFSHCLVERVVIRGGRAIGVEGRILNRSGGKPGDRLFVSARRVVVACGAWHSPLLLARSGLGKSSRQLGRNLTLHPAFRMLARFDETVHGWRGALQSAFSDAFEREGLTLVGLFVPVGVIAATLPGVGAEHSRRAEAIPHLAMFGGLIHDHGGGRVHRGFGREPFVTYRMSKRDRALVPRIIRILAETFFAAGAREAFLPVLGQRGVDADGLRRLDLERMPGRKFECSSQHPLGSCRMGVSPDRSVVDPHGKVWEVDNLHVVDGSILPTSLGVNPQLSIMTVATKIAAHLVETRPT